MEKSGERFPGRQIMKGIQISSRLRRALTPVCAIALSCLPVALFAGEGAWKYEPVWTPQPARADLLIVRKSDPKIVTHKIKSGKVSIGFSDNGGGYLNFCDVGNGLNIVSPNYGRGWQHCFRDGLHSGRYNPTQAGFSDSAGSPAHCRVENNRFIIEKYNMALFADPVNDFTEHEDLAPDYPGYKDNNNSDTDGLDEKGLTQDAELRSEFDCAGTYEDASSLTGNGIPAFRHRFFYAYAREPKAMQQFGEAARLLNGNPVLAEDKRILDVSPTALPGKQTPTDTDLSLITFEIYGMRFLKTPQLDIAAAMWRENGEWRISERKASGAALIRCLKNQYPELKTTSGDDSHVTSGKDGNADIPLFIMASGKDPKTSRAIGMFIPNIPQNVRQTVGFDRRTGERLYSEDRRLQGWFHFGWARGPHIIVVARYRLTGMLTPGRAMPNAVEVLYGDVFMLFGTPDEILQAAGNIERTVRTAGH